MRNYDYVFAGAGAAGLSLLLRLLRSGKFEQSSILLVDRDLKTRNDRTWCYWETDDGFFEEIVFRRWNHCWFHTLDFSRKYILAPYRYKMIRGSDFYRYCLEEIGRHGNVDIIYGEVKSVSAGGELVMADGVAYAARRYLFNSIPFGVPPFHKRFLWQHFKGWIIETDKRVFDTDACTLMDFRVPQVSGATFVYTMPLSDRSALVEYTLFSPGLLPDETYDKALNEYIVGYLSLDNYRVLETETGKIPMSDHRFVQTPGKCIQLGTVGGRTKASSGYTFQFIQQHSDRLLTALLTGTDLAKAGAQPGRYHFYDQVLLEVLSQQPGSAPEIFGRLFARNDIKKVLRFLDNHSELAEELGLFTTLPTLAFAKAAIQLLSRK